LQRAATGGVVCEFPEAGLVCVGGVTGVVEGGAGFGVGFVGGGGGVPGGPPGGGGAATAPTASTSAATIPHTAQLIARTHERAAPPRPSMMPLPNVLLSARAWVPRRRDARQHLN
jgi:hypothetical protein